jgi:hypothetical protein
VTNILP